MATMVDFLKRKKFRNANQVFKYDSFLGKGGFGTCYSFKSDTSDTIAVKVIDKTKVSIKSIARESELHRRLNHENVVRFFSKCEDIGYCYIVMEMCHKSLHYLAQAETSIPLSKIQKYTHDILRGLCYIHNHDIIHRDIKLENILISFDDVAKISDFGLSRDLNKMETCENGIFCGSSYYLAPEIITNFEYSPAADIWSFGVILYRLACGSYPFFGNYEDLFYRIKHIIYKRSASLNMNKNGRRLIQIFCFIFRRKELRLTSLQLLNRSFYSKPLVTDDGASKAIEENYEVANSCVIIKQLPTTLGTTVRSTLEKLHQNYNDMEVDQEEDFVYIVTYLDYSTNYGIVYFLSNNVCGFWCSDQSVLFRYNSINYYYKYLEGQRHLMPNITISKSKETRFQTLLNELLTPEGQSAKDEPPILLEPIFIDYWVKTIEFFIIILSNGSIHIEMYRDFRENKCDRYVLSGRTGRLYLKYIRNEELYLRPLSLYEQELFFKENTRILNILSQLGSTD